MIVRESIEFKRTRDIKKTLKLGKERYDNIQKVAELLKEKTNFIQKTSAWEYQTSIKVEATIKIWSKIWIDVEKKEIEELINYNTPYKFFNLSGYGYNGKFYEYTIKLIPPGYKKNWRGKIKRIQEMETLWKSAISKKPLDFGISESLEFQRTGDTKRSLSIGKARYRKDFLPAFKEIEELIGKDLKAIWLDKVQNKRQGDEIILSIWLNLPLTPVNVKGIKDKIESWLNKNTDYKIKKLLWKRGQISLILI